MIMYVYFNKEKPVLTKNNTIDSMTMNSEPKRGASKYRYINRISEIINDDMECEEIRRRAYKIK
jgi:hypothetical protein